MVELDGAAGEGGGQILRSALTLALLTQQPFKIRNVRANRRKPGLRPQHITAVHAAATISQAEVTGATTGSQSLTFTPATVSGGDYAFNIGTAGAATLVLQTILVPLCLAPADSTVLIQGGTNVPWSPCAEYLQSTWLRALAHMGFVAEAACERVGFFPKGGGLLKAAISTGAVPSSISWIQRSALSGIEIISASANLPRHIVQRQAKQAQALLRGWRVPIKQNAVQYDALDRGTLLMVLPRFETGHACFFALGERGKPAERVAEEAVDQLLEFLASDGVIDPFLADQLLIPLALAPELSEFTTSKVTRHLITNASVVEQFNLAAVEIRGQEGQSGYVAIHPQFR